MVWPQDSPADPLCLLEDTDEYAPSPVAGFLKVLGNGASGTVWLLGTVGGTVGGDAAAAAACARTAGSAGGEACCGGCIVCGSGELGNRCRGDRCCADERSASRAPGSSALALGGGSWTHGGRFALKVSSRDEGGEATCSDPRTEAELITRSRHDFIVRSFGSHFDVRNGKTYLMTEACMGGDLGSLLARLRRAQEGCPPPGGCRRRGRLPDEVARTYAVCVVSAIGYLHEQGVMYRDLKPDNLVVDGRGLLKLVDFGLAKRWRGEGGRGEGGGEGAEAASSRTLCGTPEYLAPEMVAMQGHGPPVDWWAVGVLVYEMTHGHTPFSDRGAVDDVLQLYRNIGNPAFRVCYDASLPPPLLSFAKRLLRRNPATRLGSPADGAAAGSQAVRAHEWLRDVAWEAPGAWRRLDPLSLQPTTPGAAGEVGGCSEEQAEQQAEEQAEELSGRGTERAVPVPVPQQQQPPPAVGGEEGSGEEGSPLRRAPGLAPSPKPRSPRRRSHDLSRGRHSAAPAQRRRQSHDLATRSPYSLMTRMLLLQQGGSAQWVRKASSLAEGGESEWGDSLGGTAAAAAAAVRSPLPLNGDRLVAFTAGWASDGLLAQEQPVPLATPTS